MLVAVSAIATASCHAHHQPPSTLVDGSPVAPPEVTLDLDAPQVWTKARRLHGPRGASGFADTDCPTGGDAGRSGAVVARVGVVGASVTARSAAAHIVACDDSAGRRENGARWCGRSYGRTTRGRLDDPRLDLGCSTAAGEQLAFAWFEPSRSAVYVVVDQGGYVEVYPVLGGLPVRIASSRNIDLATSSASFDVSEYDALGRLTRSSTLRTRVAG